MNQCISSLKVYCYQNNRHSPGIFVPDNEVLIYLSEWTTHTVTQGPLCKMDRNSVHITKPTPGSWRRLGCSVVAYMGQHWPATGEPSTNGAIGQTLPWYALFLCINIGIDTCSFVHSMGNLQILTREGKPNRQRGATEAPDVPHV